MRQMEETRRFRWRLVFASGSASLDGGDFSLVTRSSALGECVVGACRMPQHRARLVGTESVRFNQVQAASQPIASDYRAPNNDYAIRVECNLLGVGGAEKSGGDRESRSMTSCPFHTSRRPSDDCCQRPGDRICEGIVEPQCETDVRLNRRKVTVAIILEITLRLCVLETSPFNSLPPARTRATINTKYLRFHLLAGTT